MESTGFTASCQSAPRYRQCGFWSSWHGADLGSPIPLVSSLATPGSLDYPISIVVPEWE